MKNVFLKTLVFVNLMGRERHNLSLFPPFYVFKYYVIGKKTSLLLRFFRVFYMVEKFK